MDVFKALLCNTLLVHHGNVMSNVLSLILRLYGHGNVVLPSDEQWQDLAPKFPSIVGTRQIIIIDVHRVQISCGYGMPLYDYQGQRPTLSA
ncbi:hypothetical protein [Adonisia turfae]|nr:hypothetical protein [Adonisia turfae]